MRRLSSMVARKAVPVSTALTSPESGMILTTIAIYLIVVCLQTDADTVLC